jgi:hypothetical protein
MTWIRECQICGYRQEAKPPAEYVERSWQHVKCKHCNSKALDYGREGNDNDNQED